MLDFRKERLPNVRSVLFFAEVLPIRAKVMYPKVAWTVVVDICPEVLKLNGLNWPSLKDGLRFFLQLADSPHLSLVS